MNGFGELKGLTIRKVEGLSEGSDEVRFHTWCGREFKMYHRQDCCESVRIEDICGDVEDLEHAFVHEAREDTGETPSDYQFQYEPESYTWTFYNIQTNKGHVQIRWLGESNGYYGESANFEEVHRGREDEY